MRETCGNRVELFSARVQSPATLEEMVCCWTHAVANRRSTCRLLIALVALWRRFGTQGMSWRRGEARG